MIKKLKHFLFHNELGVKERLFRVILAVGEAVVLLAIIEGIFLKLGLLLLPLIVLAVVLAVSGIVTYKCKRVEIAATILGIVISTFTFPFMFFFSGGIEGGATVWFVLEIVYTFMLFDGVMLRIFLAVDIVFAGGCYALGYYHPEFIHAVDTRSDVFLDSFFGIVVVGIICGLIMRFQIFAYVKEREIVQKQKEELVKANQAQNAFFASMSHEIRTPINTIIGLDEMILRSNPSQEVAEYAQNVQVSSKMLLNLINDILDISQIKQQKMKIVPDAYNTSDLLYEIVEMTWLRMKQKNLDFYVEVSPELPTVLYGDVKRIQQVMVNLLSNALKYTEQGYVRLTVECDKMKEDELLLKVSVEDTGIGIRKEDMDGIYDSFRRVDTRKNSNIEGSGLGLTITKHILGLMEGTISVDSIYTKGSTFCITVKQKIIDPTPIGAVDFMQRRQTSVGRYYEHTFEAPEAKLLVVDDNEYNAFVVSKLLADTKIQIDVVRNGFECLQMTQTNYYDVILMDYMMPEMSGIETMRALKQQDNNLCRESAVVLVTASGIAEAKRLQEENGFDAYLEKPIVAKELEAQVRSLLPEDLIEYRRTTDRQTENVEHVLRFKKKKRLCITTDCICDLPEELLQENNIKVMYLYIQTPKGRFKDTNEIDSDNLAYYLLEGREEVRVESVSVEEYENFFADALDGAEEVIHISMAQNSGKSYQVAEAAAKSFDHVHVIDSGHISGGEGLVVLYIAMLAKEGYKPETILEIVKQNKHHVVSKFLLADATIFYKNGHTNQLAERICRRMHARPILWTANSRIFIHGFLLGRFPNVWRQFIHFVFMRKNRISDKIVLITYVGLTVREREIIKEEIEKRMKFKQIIMQKASFSNACNSGLSSIGIAFFRK